MKKIIFYMTIFVFMAFTIKCSNDTAPINLVPPSDVGEMVLIKVKEYKTNVPLSGVKFSTYYCKEYDFEFGNCINKILLSSCITNNNGICNCSFPKNSFEDIIIEKSMYWLKHYHSVVSDHEYEIQPESWVSINFKTDVEYPGTSEFFITINGEMRNELRYIQAANNSEAVLTLFGNEENKVDWVLYETFNSSSEILNSGSFILNPNKFENLTYTLTY